MRVLGTCLRRLTTEEAWSVQLNPWQNHLLQHYERLAPFPLTATTQEEIIDVIWGPEWPVILDLRTKSRHFTIYDLAILSRDLGLDVHRIKAELRKLQTDEHPLRMMTVQSVCRELERAGKRVLALAGMEGEVLERPGMVRLGQWGDLPMEGIREPVGTSKDDPPPSGRPRCDEKVYNRHAENLLRFGEDTKSRSVDHSHMARTKLFYSVPSVESTRRPDSIRFPSRHQTRHPDRLPTHHPRTKTSIGNNRPLKHPYVPLPYPLLRSYITLLPVQPIPLPHTQSISLHHHHSLPRRSRQASLSRCGKSRRGRGDGLSVGKMWSSWGRARRRVVSLIASLGLGGSLSRWRCEAVRQGKPATPVYSPVLQEYDSQPTDRVIPLTQLAASRVATVTSVPRRTPPVGAEAPDADSEMAKVDAVEPEGEYPTR